MWNIPGAGPGRGVPGAEPQSGRERSQGWSPREERGRELSKCTREATALESGNPVKDRASRRDLGRESWVGADPLSGVCPPVLKEEGSCWKRCGAGFLFSTHRISLWEVRAVGGSRIQSLSHMGRPPLLSAWPPPASAARWFCSPSGIPSTCPPPGLCNAVRGQATPGEDLTYAVYGLRVHSLPALEHLRSTFHWYFQITQPLSLLRNIY